ncbi:Macrolide export ATP-binding/permease protein MacB [Serratia fonticola]|jgi:putative ABC transport system permease protein|uniref:Macrolide export ATP-binding/permease protein MacB n=3 Tax=Serratia fonticola TaxID=47917 RepID=A0A0F7HGU6_SERFO|nr:ABC transporter permease [Serratia fonticola]CAI0827549.1 Macrolide export ATP-binding/permease protein MacB [Serratia fonticola]CAI0969062.1 Macrolide export ATP-binding/permease protein MacB [Serratia fonticola]CAI1011434.1 Macrolide export ATP-binding/permease protein MacB [Serratia fonticola]CAI1063886.1 Macrolide export ATP-binding/permease protein MacB [Serratia fonticola]
MAVNSSQSMFWRLVFRALRLRMQRVVVVFAALAVGAAIVTAMSAVYFDINAKMSQELRTFGANFYVGPGMGNSMAEKSYQQIVDNAPPGLVTANSPYLYGMARTELEKVVVMGVWFESLKQIVPYWQVTGNWIGVSFDDRNAMIGYKLANRLELKVGDSVVLVEGEQKKKLQIKGIVEAGDATDNVLIINLPLAQSWLHQPDLISHALFSVNNERGQVEQFAEQLQKRYPDLEIRPIRKVSASEGQVLDKIKGLMGLVSVVILVLSTLCVNTTLMAIVSERSREFALQKALGAKSSDIVRQIMAETLIIALFAVVVGIIAGYILAQVLGHTVFSASIGLRAQVIPLTVILSLLVALIAAALPTYRAVNIEPAKVLKGE